MSPPTLKGVLESGARKLRSAGLPWRAPEWPGGVDPPPLEHNLGVDYDSEWSRRYPVRLVRAVVMDNITRPIAHVLASPDVRGNELLGLAEAPLIIVANHTSHADTGLLISVLPPRLRHTTIVAGAADYFFDRRWKAHVWAGLFGAIPIERHRVNRRSADLAAELIEEGWNLLIYPEGGRSPDGWMQEFRGGAAYLAVRTSRPVVPVHLEGTGKVISRDGGKLRRSQTTVTFGMPIRPEPGESARSFGRRIEQAVHLLARERETDWWTARKQQAEGIPSPARGPDGSSWRRSWALGSSCSGSQIDDGGDWAVESGAKSRS